MQRPRLFAIVAIWLIFALSKKIRLYIAKVLDAFMDHEPVKISIYITNVLRGRLKWRARHHTPALAVVVTGNIN